MFARIRVRSLTAPDSTSSFSTAWYIIIVLAFAEIQHAQVGSLSRSPTSYEVGPLRFSWFKFDRATILQASPPASNPCALVSPKFYKLTQS